jgi:hypothetical protein
MFGELPKLLDRNFALAYFFPSMIFVMLTSYLFGNFGSSGYILPYLNGEIINDLTVVVVCTYMIGLFLLLINGELYRYLEGYGRFNPNRILIWFERNRFRKMINALQKLDDEYFECMSAQKEFPGKSRVKRNQIYNDLSYQYPDKEEFVLPTRLGNNIRAFEVYSRIMYGFEYVDGWSRLLAVVPESYRTLVDNAKNKSDLWINTLVLSEILLILEIILWWQNNNLFLLFLSGVTAVFSLFCILRANQSAVGWGDYVKSAFDTYRHDLLKILELPRPTNRDQEKDVWRRFSQSIIYRLPESLPDIAREINLSSGKVQLEISQQQPHAQTPQDYSKEILYVTPPEVRIELVTPYKIRKKNNRTL